MTHPSDHPAGAREPAHAPALAALREALAAGRDGLVAALLLDATDVRRVDRALGHAVGEGVLDVLEQRLQARTPDAHAIVRLARERIVVVASPASREHASALAQQLVAAVRAPISVGDLEVRVDVALGLALASTDDDGVEALLRDADDAAQRAAESTTAWQLADPLEHDRRQRRLRLEHELAGALARDELALYFQPIVSVRRGTLVGVEALVRWRHPQRGLLGPAQFLPAAEQSGLILDIGDWMLAAVCGQLERWSTSHPERVLPPVALNVSGRELRDAAFAARVTDALLAARIPPESIALEIGDPGVLDEGAEAEEAMSELRRLGVRIVLDRFGGARSSLAHLARLPIDGLKLDGSLLGPRAGEAPIAEAIVELARALGLSITVPGIETEHQLAAVRALEVDAAQGHLIARPAPAASLDDLQDLEISGQGRAGGATRATEPADELLPLSAVAEALGVSPSTVRRLADQGVLPGTRTEGGHRRFRRGDVQRLARRRRRRPALRTWDLPARPLTASAELLTDDGRTLVERAARSLYEAQRPGWFAAPQGLARSRGWLAALSAALAAGAPGEALAATAAFADAATLGGASGAEVVRFLAQFGAVASHELVRTHAALDEGRALQRLMSAAMEAFVERL